jgi:hypothetical protein
MDLDFLQVGTHKNEGCACTFCPHWWQHPLIATHSVAEAEKKWTLEADLNDSSTVNLLQIVQILNMTLVKM